MITAGIDVWGGTRVSDWSKLMLAGPEFGADNLSWCTVKCTDGMSRDPGYNQNLAGANGAGFFTGVYHVVEFGSDAGAQMKNFRDCATGQYDFPGSLDIETSPSSAPVPRVAKVMDCIKAFEDLFQKKPILYSYPAYMRFLVSYAPQFPWSDYLLWESQFFFPRVDGVTKQKAWLYGQQPMAIPPWKDYTIWQFGGDANGFTVSGIQGYADMSIFRGSLEDLKALLCPLPLPT